MQLAAGPEPSPSSVSFLLSVSLPTRSHPHVCAPGHRGRRYLRDAIPSEALRESIYGSVRELGAPTPYRCPHGSDGRASCSLIDHSPFTSRCQTCVGAANWRLPGGFSAPRHDSLTPRLRSYRLRFPEMVPTGISPIARHGLCSGVEWA